MAQIVKTNAVKKNNGFEVEAGRWNLRFKHSDNEGMTQWGPIQAYYLDEQFGEGDIGINYGVSEDGSVYHADFICYGDSPEFYALEDGDNVGLQFNSEEEMIEAFKKWLKSLEIPMDEDGYTISESTKKSQPTTKSFNDMVKKQRDKNIRKSIDRDWIAQRCIGVKEDYEHHKKEILSIFEDFIDEMEIENGESFMNYFQSYEFIDVDEAVDNMIKTVKRQFGIQ